MAILVLNCIRILLNRLRAISILTRYKPFAQEKLNAGRPAPVVDTRRAGYLYSEKMRVLAIDFGSKNIGTAISDGLGITVRPVETIRRSGLARDIARLKFLVEDLDARAVVIGLPIRMDGTMGDAARRVMKFAQSLRAALDVPVFTQDERLTSYEAERMMIERGLGPSERRARSDEFAAMIILEDYLSASARRG
jgi:putative Holliday junction resolvase